MWWLAIVVENCSYSLSMADGGIEWRGEIDKKRFIALELGIAIDQDSDGLDRLSGGKRESAAGALVIVVGQRGGRIGGRIIDGDGLIAGIGQAQGEDGVGGAAVAFGH